MESIKVKYEHGHFYALETNNRILPIQGKHFIITPLEEKSFRLTDEKLHLLNDLNAIEKKKKVYAKFEPDNCERLLKAGRPLLFRIGIAKKAIGDVSREYFFKCILREDLYLVKIKHRDGKIPEDWRLADCNCEIVECISGEINHIEKLHSVSLSNLFREVVQLYFQNQRSDTTNVFNAFFISDGISNNYKSDLSYNSHKEKLSNLREKFVKERNSALKDK